MEEGFTKVVHPKNSYTEIFENTSESHVDEMFDSYMYVAGSSGDGGKRRVEVLESWIVFHSVVRWLQ